MVIWRNESIRQHIKGKAPATGTYNTVYDANVLNNIEYGEDFSYVARVSGSWKDGE